MPAADHSVPAPPSAPLGAHIDPPAPSRRPRRHLNALTAWLRRHERWFWATGMLSGLVLAGWPGWTRHAPATPDLAQIEARVRESLMQRPLPSATATAYALIAPSVVRVVGTPGSSSRTTGPRERQRAGRVVEEASPHIGSGVVIVDHGLILTNLHVVRGLERIRVTFADGTESRAELVNAMPEHDLAVLRASTLPDDLKPATLRSSTDLRPGESVVAVGFPFDIGPTATAGVVSGLERSFQVPGGRLMRHLIQFDAAANPGSSGGPLVTLDGHVVGIVTAIMNPTGLPTFAGISFAVPIESAAQAAGMPPF